jgi:D-alanine-D-alanine ligase
VEKFIEDCKEYNISVLEKNGEIITSSIEEVVKTSDVLDYSQKYENNSKLEGMLSSERIVPASIDDKVKKEIEEYAIKIYKHFGAKGVIRIDFLCNDKVYVNEINSIPGSYAFYLWKEKMDFLEIIDAVIETSKRDNFRENKRCKTIEKMNIFDNYKSGYKAKG